MAQSDQDLLIGQFAVPEFATAFAPGPTIADLADALIEEHSEKLGHLRDFAIDYLWKRKGGRAQGEDRKAGCKITGEFERHYSKKVFIVWLAADHVRNLKLNAKQIEALLFSYLLRLGEDKKNGGPRMIQPDFQGFRAELEAYGAWNDKLAQLGDTVRQWGFEDIFPERPPAAEPEAPGDGEGGEPATNGEVVDLAAAKAEKEAVGAK